jgi:uncharacterized protein
MSGYDGPIIDVDIHHRPVSNDAIRGYLSPRWRDYLSSDGRTGAGIKPPMATPAATFDGGGRREDTVPETGPAGSSYELLREQLLDRYELEHAILTHDLGEYAAHPNPYFARDLCRAVNEHHIDEWLARDDRLTLVAAVPSAVPADAATDLRTYADNPRIVGVLMSANALGRPIGDPIYHPLYAAAEECGMTICVHPAAGDRPNLTVSSVAGPKGTAIEHVSQYAQQAMHYISSLVVHGVFDKFPRLQWVINEYGITWLPSLLWRLDAMYPVLRRESPWVKELPSAAIKRHVKLSTQPIETGKRSGSLAQLLGTLDGIDRLLCYSSDYPHISMDDARYVRRLLPNEWHRRVFHDNACESYPRLAQLVPAGV